MARYLLDTGIIIGHLRGQKEFVQLVRGLGRADRLAIATVTRLEIYAGLRDDESYVTRKLLSRFVNLSLDATIADRAGELAAAGQLRNKPLAIPDAIIAATAIKHQLTLLTLNRQDFEGLPGLRLYLLHS